ncbi:MAG: glycoside hydrolase family 13 protein [Pseudoramibacter sp.]|nr:glycoside hydrolase family 13 protein [Pseudoramibacter sp.]MCH4106469.1 glycoside hydrolase family 13 protein [Pseudoramibacter sp.]
MPNQPGLLWYHFQFEAYNHQYQYGTQSDHLGGEGEIYDRRDDVPSYQITLFDEGRTVPEWYKNGIMYQIFPDRFAKPQNPTYHPQYFPSSMIHGNWNDTPHYFRNADGSIEYWDYFGGTLEGIIEKLDYLKTLHVSILYLNPIFEANSNHKYNTADYKKIAREFGNEEIFKRLCAEAQKRSIRIILDGVFNHTGDDSIYFNKYGRFDSLGAYQSKDSPYYNWYRFSHYPDQYDSWWGIGNMPDVEENNPDYRNYIFNSENSVINKWTQDGASGWRLDVADELPDDFIADLKSALMKKNEDAVLIGEVWENASNKISYGVQRQYFMGHELDGVMNYPFRQTFIDFLLYHISSKTAVRQMMSLYETYPKEQFMSNMNLIDSHDRPRALTVLAGVDDQQMTDSEKEHFRLKPEQRALAVKRLKLLSLIQMTFPGIPCIYYGDEAGCEGFGDPYNRGTYPWGNEDRELLKWYEAITTLRAKSKTLAHGIWYPIKTTDDLLAYLRVYKQTVILCLFNRSDHAFVTLKHNLFRNVIGREMLLHTWEKLDGITVKPLSAKIYRLQITASKLFQNNQHEIKNLLTQVIDDENT